MNALQDKWILKHGIPINILSDNGPSFRSRLNEHIKNLYGYNFRFTTSYNPRCNGACENANKYCKVMLASIGCDLEIAKPHINLNWSKWLDNISFIHNTSVHPSTGFSPWRLRKLEAPPDVTIVLTNLQNELAKLNKSKTPELYTNFENRIKLYHKVKKLSKQNINKYIRNKYRIHKKNIGSKQARKRKQIKIGSLVHLRIEGRTGMKKKLNVKYTGPYLVIRLSTSGNAYELQHIDSGKTFWASIRRIKLISRANSSKLEESEHLTISISSNNSNKSNNLDSKLSSKSTNNKRKNDNNDDKQLLILQKLNEQEANDNEIESIQDIMEYRNKRKDFKIKSLNSRVSKDKHKNIYTKLYSDLYSGKMDDCLSLDRISLVIYTTES